jgi:hypothetical protein
MPYTYMSGSYSLTPTWPSVRHTAEVWRQWYGAYPTGEDTERLDKEQDAHNILANATGAPG